MYFKDAHGRMWLKTDNGFQNIGVTVTEKIVTFRKVDTVKVIPSPVVGRRSPVDSAAGSFTPRDYGRKPIGATKKSEQFGGY